MQIVNQDLLEVLQNQLAEPTPQWRDQRVLPIINATSSQSTKDLPHKFWNLARPSLKYELETGRDILLEDTVVGSAGALHVG